MGTFNWTCAHCNHPTTITDNELHTGETLQWRKSADGTHLLSSRFIICPNQDCKKVTLEVWLHELSSDNRGNHRRGSQLRHWQLVPSSNAKSFPEYIPEGILKDYEEACLIRDLSPKASATLSRRCLQGIIRDFWSVKPGRLVSEIEAIKEKVDPLVWESIDTIRKIGNIGAHMEKDINLIVDVEPQEAELLLGLIEMLLREWYILREERKQRLEKIVNIGAEKQKARRGEP